MAPAIAPEFSVLSVSKSGAILRLFEVEGEMKILRLVVVGGMLTTLALAQQPSRRIGRGGVIHNFGRRTESSAVRATPDLMAYVVNIAFEFGALDLRSGAFLPIGPGLPPDVGDGLVQGPGTSLLSLGFDGNLIAIDPFTGQTSLVGATGLGDCSTPASPCGQNSANWIGRINGRYYVTDFANNLYSLNPYTAATKLIGPTGIPALTTIPFSQNPDGSINVFGEGLFGSNGKFYAYFAMQAVNLETGGQTILIPGEIYEVDPVTGQATPVAPASSNYSAIATVNNTVYAFDGLTGEVQIVNPATGDATAVATLDPSAVVIAGVAPAAPAGPAVHSLTAVWAPF